ncbi:Methylated-DNA--protein-cysteine methyltransferase [Pseudovibrio axinellae]|uniref:Methylated-DNA--protein-cysteine methyltransferase n=1 Tax=Pseudovibrio axinellae TaxID=989403 RepID=A0A165T104_9HYPH|nr:methylated-DNA--[protein]-cysteine S-methyltransferase [Pseudovibrio axinellae]KZL05148.1 Methylated-DNA--protein-cysteine methyltransferase [Pseudovibrio axinellae]SER50063.1 methylated-DNA-[protein]-cysteine S-methyltransferase [Pseudovibrio axinellae]
MTSSISTTYCTYQSPVGSLLIGGENGGLEFIRFPESKRRHELAENWVEDEGPYDELIAQLTSYFAGELKVFSLDWQLNGTDFQKSVWAQLAKIPFGETRSYGDVAKALGNPGASRAVGLANNANPLPIVIPCHRVIGANGALVGFGGGLDTKVWLLDHENIPHGTKSNKDQMAFNF